MLANDVLQQITNLEASDVFIIPGLPLSYKSHGMLNHFSEDKLTPTDTNDLIQQIYALADDRDISFFHQTGDDDFSFAIKGVSRFRVNTYRQRGTYSAVIRIITFLLPSPEVLGIPDTVMNLANTNQGLVLVTGPAGGGKSTTLACIIDKINQEREAHIITLEDPLEYLHQHQKSIVSQREIASDTQSYLTALRASLRQCPDVILLGEMRDYETINVAMTAAETGHLIFSTLHTIGASNTIDRIIDAFPASAQRQISIQLSMVLQAVISQRLLPSKEGKLVSAFEIMVLTPAIRNLIRESKVHQIEGLLYNSSTSTLTSMDTSIVKLYQQGIITKEIALENATNPEMMAKKLN